MGGAEGRRLGGPKSPPLPELTVRRLEPKLSGIGELSYELLYAAGGGSGPVESMPKES